MESLQQKIIGAYRARDPAHDYECSVIKAERNGSLNFRVIQKSLDNFLGLFPRKREVADIYLCVGVTGNVVPSIVHTHLGSVLTMDEIFGAIYPAPQRK